MGGRSQDLHRRGASAAAPDADALARDREGNDEGLAAVSADAIAVRVQEVDLALDDARLIRIARRARPDPPTGPGVSPTFRRLPVTPAPLHRE